MEEKDKTKQEKNNKPDSKKVKSKKVSKSKSKKTTSSKKKNEVKPKKKQEQEIINNEKIEEKTKILNEEAMFNVWVDILILIFVLVMFAVILYGYIVSA